MKCLLINKHILKTILLLLLILKVLCSGQYYSRDIRFFNQVFLFYLYIKRVTCKFVIISSSEIFSFNIFYFIAVMYFFLTNSGTSWNLFSTTLIFVLRTVVVAKSVMKGIFFSTFSIFFQISFVCVVLICLN